MRLPVEVINRRGQRRPKGPARSDGMDPVDAQLSDLLESIEVDQREPTPAPRPARRSRVPLRWRARPRTRKRTPDAPRKRAERGKPKPSADGSRRAFEPKAVSVEPRRARIGWLRDRAIRERVYYILVVVASGTALGLLCAWLLA
jgi:hypothetical protein